LLNAALAHGPNNARALTLLADLATRDWEGAGEALEKLEQALAQGTAPGAVHIILGTRALQRNDYEAAWLHLELAYKANPQIAVVLNNLAWTIANRADPDLERALQLAKAARKLSNHPEITDTIGNILARMGKEREAVVELEAAVRSFPQRAELHATLAELYDKLGDPRLAKVHRQLAEQAKPRP